jgi:hypothetical protein
MKIIRQFYSLCGFVLLFILYAARPIENDYVLAQDYSVTIHGTSNLHNWDEKVEKVSGQGVIKWNSDGSFDLTNISINMDVQSIKGSLEVMNKNTYKALKGDKNPRITFVINTPIHSIAASGTVVTAKGDLSIAGVTRTLDIRVKLGMQGKNKLIFEGSQGIKMSDFGVTPPTAIFGALKTGDAITITFKTGFTEAKLD